MARRIREVGPRCASQESVDGGGGQRFGHEGVEPGGVDVAGDGDRAAFVGGLDDSVERFGSGLPCGKHAYVIDDHQIGAGDPGDGAGDAAVGVRLSWTSAADFGVSAMYRG